MPKMIITTFTCRSVTLALEMRSDSCLVQCHTFFTLVLWCWTSRNPLLKTLRVSRICGALLVKHWQLESKGRKYFCAPANTEYLFNIQCLAGSTIFILVTWPAEFLLTRVKDYITVGLLYDVIELHHHPVCPINTKRQYAAFAASTLFALTEWLGAA